jgi:hypothetical protein
MKQPLPSVITEDHENARRPACLQLGQKSFRLRMIAQYSKEIRSDRQTGEAFGFPSSRQI